MPALSSGVKIYSNMKPIRIIVVENLNGMKKDTEKPVYEKDGRFFVVHGKLKFNEVWIKRNALKRKIAVIFQAYG